MPKLGGIEPILATETKASKQRLLRKKGLLICVCFSPSLCLSVCLKAALVTSTTMQAGRLAAIRL